MKNWPISGHVLYVVRDNINCFTVTTVYKGVEEGRNAIGMICVFTRTEYEFF